MGITGGLNMRKNFLNSLEIERGYLVRQRVPCHWNYSEKDIIKATVIRILAAERTLG